MPKRKKISQATRNMKMKKRRREMADDERDAIRKEARERLKQRIATETAEEREVRLAKVREMVRLRRHNESASRREQRLKRAREQQRARRAALETEEQREARQLRQQRRVQRLAAEHKKEKLRMERAENWREQIVQWQMNQSWQGRPHPQQPAVQQPSPVKHHHQQPLPQQLQPQQILGNGIKPIMGDMFVPNGQFIPPQPLMFSASSAPRPVMPANPLHAYFALIGLRPQPRKPEIPNVKKIPGLPDVVLKSVNQEGMFAHFQEPTNINNGYFASPPPWIGSLAGSADDDSVDPLLNCEVVMKEQSDDEDSYDDIISRTEDDDEDDFPEGLSLSCQQEMTVGDPSTLTSIVSPSASSEDLVDDFKKVEYPVSCKPEPKMDPEYIESVKHHKRSSDHDKMHEFKIGDVTVIRPTENGSKKEIDLSCIKQEIEEVEEEEDSLDYPERVGDVTLTRNGGSIKPKLEISKIKSHPPSLDYSLPVNVTHVNSDKGFNKNQVDDNSITLTKILNNNARYLDLSNVSQENLQRLRSIPACISISNSVSVSATHGQ